MTTPSTYSTAERIIRFAMRDAGLLQEGDDPNSEQFAENMNRLNDVINFEQTQGLKVWLQFFQTIKLVAGQATYSLSVGGDVNITRPTRMIAAMYQESNSQNSRPLILLSRDEYNRMSNKTIPGAINSFWPNKLRTSLQVTFWLTPDAQAATGTVIGTIQQQCGTVVSLTDDMDFPPEWFMFLRWALAEDLSSGQPEAIQAKCSSRATVLREAMTAWDVEDASTTFQMDPRTQYNTGMFR